MSSTDLTTARRYAEAGTVYELVNISLFTSLASKHSDMSVGQKDAGEAEEGLPGTVGDGWSPKPLDRQAGLLQQRPGDLYQQQTGENPGHSGPRGRGQASQVGRRQTCRET